jgi:hypothetical protein
MAFELTHIWNVLSGQVAISIEHQWTVFEPLAPLPMTWTVLPPGLVAAFENTYIQRPVATMAKTP